MHIAIATLSKELTTANYTRGLFETQKEFCTNPENKITLLLDEPGLLTTGRNKQFWKAKKLNVDGLLMVDSDIAFPGNGLQKTIDVNKDIVTGIYYNRQYPHRPYIHTFNENDLITNFVDYPTNKPFLVESCGGGFLYISRKALDAFDKIDGDEPFDLMKNKQGLWAGEDTSFCLRCRDKGIEIWAEPTIRLGHVRMDTVWPEYWEHTRKIINTKNGIKTSAIKINGWLTEKEIAWLTKKSKEMESVLEIGAWKGRSTAAIASGCKGYVYTVDHFRGSEEQEHKQALVNEAPIFSQFALNMVNYDNLIVMKMDSMNAVTLFPDNSIDMIFIDGGHDYDTVRKDILKWTPKARKIICGHDYCNEWSDVKRAVNDSFDDFNLEDTIWWIDLRPYK